MVGSGVGVFIVQKASRCGEVAVVVSRGQDISGGFYGVYFIYIYIIWSGVGRRC